MSGIITETIVEEATLEWFEQFNYATLHGSEIAPEEPSAERQDYADVVLINCLRFSLATFLEEGY